eukprot:TRINITY_DN15153_c0_g1_i1.p1 TRINITY_DN15153_c0_g1~~TRINITY_DN15153_c0_g1_i1.p1  ORF type:complete len:266 (+),score=41.38 TRINITY_DN15153_c0_g1_i1:315-1112(+)
MKVVPSLMFIVIIAACSCSQLDYSISVNLGSGLTYDLAWSLDSNQVTFQITVNSIAWVGLGWHSVGSDDDAMTKADFAICIFNKNGTLTVTDRYADNSENGFTAPVLDTNEPYPGGKDNILTYSGTQSNGYTIVQFSRALDTGDNKADNNFSNGTQKILFAVGSSNDWGFHTAASELNVDLFTGHSSAVDDTIENYKFYHAVFMTISYVILMSLTIFIARFLKKMKNGTTWWYLHLTFNFTLMILTVAGFIMIVIYYNKRGKKTF